MTFIAENLTCSRPLLTFPPVSFTLEAGGLLWISGANGTGKSTLLRTLAGLLPAHSGKINNPYVPLYIGHASGLSAHLSAAEHLSFWAGLADMRNISAGSILKKIGLDLGSREPAGKFSAGQQRRLALCRLLLETDKKLWLLDEPQAGLDVQGIALLQKLIAGHRQAGGLAVIALHQGLAVDGAQELRLKGAV